MQTPLPNPAEQLAARLLYLTQQEKIIEKEKKEVKEALEELHSSDQVATKTDVDVLYSDGTFHKVRLQRVPTGTYFKVEDDFRDEFSQESHRMQAKYLKAGKAKMADKACTWRAQEVKS
jgi:hypothetical protein